MGKIISFSNKKGGVGKTTTAINMAAYCADLGKKVLLVDIDSQGNATTGLGFSKSALKKSVYNVLIEDDNAASNILPTQVKLLDILPANVDLTGGGGRPRLQKEQRADFKVRPRKNPRRIRLHIYRLSTVARSAYNKRMGCVRFGNYPAAKRVLRVGGRKPAYEYYCNGKAAP